jgi:alanine-glyoxylate transaminase/serine-glyoxylate transaminase/serine-pyruvate transaminase
MLPPGLGFNAVSEKALAAAKANASTRSYWDWHDIIAANRLGSWPYTPATNLLYALKEAIAMLHEEGLEGVFARHRRHGAATRAALNHWSLENVCVDPAEYSPALTAVLLPRGHDADQFREVVLQRFDMSLGTGLGKLKGRAFRIGHLGHFNDLMLMGTLAGVEMGLGLAGVSHRRGGVDAAMSVLAGNDRMTDAPRANASAQ